MFRLCEHRASRLMKTSTLVRSNAWGKHIEMESNRMHTILVLLFLFSARFIGADDFGTNGVIVSAKTNQTACEAIHPERLPEECICRDPDKYGLIIECMKPFNSPFFNDTIGMKISIDPCCPEGINISIEIIEKQHDIDFEVAGIKSGDELNIPIPGLSLIIPSIGHFGIDTTVAVYGNLDKLSILIGKVQFLFNSSPILQMI